MGYRYYIGSISNKKFKDIKRVENYNDLQFKINPNKILKDDDYIGVYDIVEETMSELGSDTCYISKMSKTLKKDIFLNKEFNKIVTSGHDFFSINKEGLIYIIDSLEIEVKKYYQRKWALTIFLEVLLTKDIEEIKYLKKEFVKACEYIFTKEYNRYKYDLTDLNNQIEDLLNKDFETIKLKYIKYISQELSTYFSQELYDYSDNYKFYDTNEDKPFKITSSWKIDKNILELVHILKTFNFKKNKLIIYGY